VADAAKVYLEQLKAGLDPTVVPVFEPGLDVDLGAFGSFERGRFNRRGSVVDRGLSLDVRQTELDPWWFATSGGVDLGPSAQVPGLGGKELVKASLTFSKGDAVVVSYGPGSEVSVKDADAFRRQLQDLWLAKQLPLDRCVVWRVRRAPGLVLVATEKGSVVDVSLDLTALVAAGIAELGLPELRMGVNWRASRGTVYGITGDALVQSISLFCWIEDTIQSYGFERGESGPARDDDRTAVVAATIDEVLKTF
jgi:hypothetical protein